MPKLLCCPWPRSYGRNEMLDSAVMVPATVNELEVTSTTEAPTASEVSFGRRQPKEVAVRKLIVEKRLIRRVYTAPYYLHAWHLDYNCKATLPGGVRLYSYGHVRARAPASHAAPNTRFHLPF